MKLSIALIVAIFGFAGCASTPRHEEAMPPNLREIGEKQMHFHEAPSAATYLEIVSANDRILAFSKHAGGDKADMDHTKRLLAVFAAVAWKKYGYSGAPYSEAEMRKTAEAAENVAVATVDDLDVLWGCFFATGEERFLDRLCDAAASKDAMISGAAKWSLKENYAQQKVVKAYIDQRPDLKTAIFAK